MLMLQKIQIKIWLKSTELIRKYLSLLRYDTGSSLPFILGLITTCLVLANLAMVFLKQTNNLEKCFLALKDILTVIALFSCTIKRVLNPEESIRLTKLIEEQFFVDRQQLDEGGSKWGRIRPLYDEKRKDLESASDTITVFIHVAYMGFVVRYIFSELLGTTLEDKSRGFPTPLVTYNPSDFDQISFFLYIFALQSFLMLFLALEAFSGYALLWLCVKKIMTDFETIYILLNEIEKDYPGFTIDDYLKRMRLREKELSDGHVESMEEDMRIESCRKFFWRDGVDREENLRKDMGLIVKFHQNLNRNQDDCARVSGYSILVISFLVALDTCFNIFLMLQNEIFRQCLAEVPWIDKPDWFKRSMIIMMTRANVDTQFKPYGVFVLNLTSYKDLMKAAFSFGNVLYRRKQIIN
ncbi:uncharacterized protein LOC111044210 isoform X2 [Nilaparvata lugens]|uniref:uncharacterized protein LOC111044210 isoform X2 n=1 Tax=Nilaparvata lugens TaxID=108931 RepID=UPI00193CF969|nr:uncharacterized protein LOC111044210 isoform X2 [Nilaparvata lugens]